MLKTFPSEIPPPKDTAAAGCFHKLSAPLNFLAFLDHKE